MHRRFLAQAWFAAPCRWVLSVGAILAATQNAEAGLTLTSSSSQVVYALHTTSSTGVLGSPQFSSGGLLLTPGGGLPILGGVPSGSPFQVNGTSSLQNPFYVTSVTVPDSSTSNGVPSAFGTAGAAVFSQGTGQEGALTSKGGIFFDTRTTLTDNITSPGLASVSFTSAVATFQNTGTTTVTVDPASILSVKGSISGLPGSFVAAGLSTSILLPGATGYFNLTPIALAANQSGLTVNSTGNGPFDASSVSFSNSQLTATATSYYNANFGVVTIAPGQSLTIQTYLTLVSDPGSTISIVSTLAPGFQGTEPTFGVFSGGSASAVPEPSAILMVGLGLTAVAAWRARGHHRRSA